MTNKQAQSLGSILGGVAGAALGSIIGMPTLGYTVGANAGGFIGGELSQDEEGNIIQYKNGGQMAVATLQDYFAQQGRPYPTYDERKAMWDSFVGDGVYTGTPVQNRRLLRTLMRQQGVQQFAAGGINDTAAAPTRPQNMPAGEEGAPGGGEQSEQTNPQEAQQRQQIDQLLSQLLGQEVTPDIKAQLFQQLLGRQYSGSLEDDVALVQAIQQKMSEAQSGAMPGMQQGPLPGQAPMPQEGMGM